MVPAVLIGFAFGFLGSMPVAGPISLLVLHLGLANEGRRAFHLALGAALAEGAYALLAFWGLSAALARYPLLLPASRILGAVIPLALGGAMLARRPRGATPPRALCWGQPLGMSQLPWGQQPGHPPALHVAYPGETLP